MKAGFTIKDIVYIGLIGIGLFFGYQLYKDLTAQIEDQKVAYKQLADNIARSSSEFVTKDDLDKFGDKVSKSFDIMKKDIKKLGGQVIGISNTVAELEAHTDRDQESDHTAQVDDGQGGKTTQDFKKIKNGDGLPMAWAMYTVGKELPWTTGTYPLEFHINTILGTTKNDKIIPVHELLVYNNKDPETKGKPFKIKIKSSTFKQTKPDQYTFFKWAPHLDFGANVGASLTGKAVFGADLGFSIMAYGRTKNDNLWRFGRVSLGLRDKFSKPQLTGSPIGYNLGKLIPLISDMWIYPTIGFGFGSGDTYSLGASIATTF